MRRWARLIASTLTTNVTMRTRSSSSKAPSDPLQTLTHSVVLPWPNAGQGDRSVELPAAGSASQDARVGQVIPGHGATDPEDAAVNSDDIVEVQVDLIPGHSDAAS